MPCRNRRTALAAASLVAAVVFTIGPSPVEAIASFDESSIHVVMTGPGQTVTGDCAGRLVPTTGDLKLACSHDVPGGRTVITRGRLDEGGTIVFDLGFGGIVDGDFSMSQQQTAELLTGALHVAVTSAGFPLGQVSARLLPQTPIGEQLMRFPLTNEDLVSTPSPATGRCAIRIRAGNGPITLLCVHDVPSPTSLQLVIDGGVAKTAGGVQSPFEIDMPELRNNFARFIDGDFGVRLHSNAFPGGELGQVLDKCIEGPSTLCLNEWRFAASVQFQAPNQAPKAGKTVPPRSDDSGLFWFFNPANWEILIKVLDPCAGAPNHFWVFLSANTNVAFTTTVLDTLTGRVRTYSNAQGHIADTVADTVAFPCN